MNLKAILASLAVLFALVGGSYSEVCVFATKSRVYVLERRITANDIYWIQKQLWQLEDRYGHLDCNLMNAMDKERCRELKAMLGKLKRK